MSTRLGTHWTTEETSFGVWAPDATRVELCLFAADDSNHELARHDLTATEGIWAISLSGIAPGTPYGFRAHGPFQPDQGHWFNPAKLLMDPYARSLAGHVTWHSGLASARTDGKGAFSIDPIDNARYVQRSIVVDPAFDWEGVSSPNTPLEETIIYEVHVKGLSQLHPDVPVDQRGTYAGAAHPAIIEHLQRLGVTAVEFLPLHAHLDDSFLVERGLENYWGYNTVGFFAPESSYAAGTDPGSELNEFREMVREYHRAGIEVLLDVVYNHTAEANHQGPMLSFRGLANDRYYRLMDDNKAHYLNITGTGNTVNVHTPEVTTLVLDSLRYWVTEMGVDGFRFDLAPVLGRTESDFDRDAPFFHALAADPILSKVKMIAEP